MYIYIYVYMIQPCQSPPSPPKWVWVHQSKSSDDPPAPPVGGGGLTSMVRWANAQDPPVYDQSPVGGWGWDCKLGLYVCMYVCM